MSRIKLTPKNPNHEVHVGLDRPLATFFILVTHKQDDDDLRDLPAIEFRARWSRGKVLEKIDQYAEDNEITRLVKEAIGFDEDPGTYFKLAGKI